MEYHTLPVCRSRYSTGTAGAQREAGVRLRPSTIALVGVFNKRMYVTSTEETTYEVCHKVITIPSYYHCSGVSLLLKMRVEILCCNVIDKLMGSACLSL